MTRWPVSPRRAILALAACLACTDSATCGSAITISVQQGEITLEVTDATRREALEELFLDREVVTEWRYPALAEEVIRGRYGGSLEVIARSLLQRCNYILFYSSTAGEKQITHIIVYGPSRPAPSSLTSANNEIAHQAPRTTAATVADQPAPPAWKLAPLRMQEPRARRPSPDPRSKGRRLIW
jgi:hypothetical protein